MPAGWTEQEAAAGPLVSLTAWQALTQWGDLPLVDSVWPMERVPEAFARLAAGPMGKVLIDVRL